MKREQGDDNVGSVKRLSSSAPVVQSQIFAVHPQHFTSVPVLPQAGPGSIVGTPTTVVISNQAQNGTIGGDQCLIGSTIAYAQPSVHSGPCNIVLASPQSYVTSVPVSHISSSCSSNSGNNLIPVTQAPVSHVPNTCNASENLSDPHGCSSVVTSYSLVTPDNNYTEIHPVVSYSDICEVKREAASISSLEIADREASSTGDSQAIQEQNKEVSAHQSAESTSEKTLVASKIRRSKFPKGLSKRLQDSKHSSFILKRSQESLQERQERLSQKLTALIRSKILELVRARGVKKTVCPSEVARALSPKAWRDLMPNVRKVGSELVKEGLILVTQRGIIVDLETVRGPMENTLASVGERIECDGARGTVKWVGEVPTTQGIWYGIDWDDETRGKHDGSHKGEKYFETRSSTSGSFVRPTKVTLGLSLEEAVRGRYQDDATIESQHTEQLQRAIRARFVEVVGMEKIARKQSKLEDLRNVVLDGWRVKGAGSSDLSKLLPHVQELNLANSLLSSWESVAEITRQLPRLKFLDLSGNKLTLPERPEELIQSLNHIGHLVLNNMMGYEWNEILRCCTMFPSLKNLQIAYNHLSVLGPIPSNLLNSLEDLDIGANPIPSWQEICHLGSLQRLKNLNANNCAFPVIDFPATPFDQKTELFPSLNLLTIANNPLAKWESVGSLNKLPVLENLVMSYDEKDDAYFQEFAFARITSLMVFNRCRISAKEKRDCELFYLKSFNEEYYSSGGKEDMLEAEMTTEFQHRHPNYLLLAKEHGTPVDESKFKAQKLRDTKIKMTVETPNDPTRESFQKAVLPSIKVAKLKMMLKRQLKINPATNLQLSYCSSTDKSFEILIDNDMKEMAYYSMASGDILLVKW